MKKILSLLLILASVGTTTFAQTVIKKEDKVKRTSTIPQKIHNTFSRHKHYSGYKVKHVKRVENDKH